MGRGGESPRYGQGWRVSKVWAGVDTVFFYWGGEGLMTEKKGRVYVPSIEMINLTMVVNSTNIIMKFDRDFRIMIL